jgi:hypothetical protein
MDVYEHIGQERGSLRMHLSFAVLLPFLCVTRVNLGTVKGRAADTLSLFHISLVTDTFHSTYSSLQEQLQNDSN